MSKRLIWFVFPLLLAVALAAAVFPIRISGAAPPALKDYEAVGQAQIKARGAEKGAEDEALRRAVENAIKELADEAALKEKAASVQKLLRNPRRYVEEIRVVDRSEAGSTVILKLRARVKVDLLRQDLLREGVLAAERGAGTTLTRVVVLPAGAGDAAPPWWAAGGPGAAPAPLTSAMVDVLRARGFEVQEPRRPVPDPDANPPPPPDPKPDMDREHLLSVGRSYGADLVVRVPWKMDTGTRSVDGVHYAVTRVSAGPVEAISVKDGKTVATVEAEGVAGEMVDLPGPKGAAPPAVAARLEPEAMKDAGENAAQRLAATLGPPVAQEGGAAAVELVVAGLDSYVAFARFETALTSEVKAVRSAALTSIERGEAHFRLMPQRGKDGLAVAEELSRKEFAEFTVKVTEKTPERVVVHVVR